MMAQRAGGRALCLLRGRLLPPGPAAARLGSSGPALQRAGGAEETGEGVRAAPRSPLASGCRVFTWSAGGGAVALRERPRGVRGSRCPGWGRPGAAGSACALPAQSAAGRAEPAARAWEYCVHGGQRWVKRRCLSPSATEEFGCTFSTRQGAVRAERCAVAVPCRSVPAACLRPVPVCLVQGWKGSRRPRVCSCFRA